MRKFSFHPLRLLMQYQREKSICECKGRIFCLILSISKYEFPVKDKVSLFCIIAFSYNYGFFVPIVEKL